MFSLVKTKIITALSDTVANVVSNPAADIKSRDKQGIIIEGPKGTGKSCILYYLMNYLKSKQQRVLLVGPVSSSDEKVVMKYYKEYINEQDEEFKTSK